MENLTKQLARIIDVGTRRNPLPMKKGNSIRVGIVLFDTVLTKDTCCLIVNTANTSV